MRNYSRVAPVALLALLALTGCGDSGKPAGQAASDSSAAVSSATAASDPKTDATPAPASSPAATTAIDLSFIGPDHFAALVVNVRRIAQLPLVAQQLKDEAVDKQVKKLGIDPAEVEQLIVLAPLPETGQPGAKPSEYSATLIAHFTHPVDVKAILTKILEAKDPGRPAKITEIQVAGKTCYETSTPAEMTYAPNATTIISTTKHYMEKIVTAGEPKGPLVERLKRADADNCVIGVIALDNFPDLDKLLEQSKRGAPPLMVSYLDAAKTLRGGQATINFKSDALLHVTLDAKTEATAADIATLFENGMQMLNGLLGAAKMQIPPEQKKTFAGALKLGDQLIAGAAAKTTGTRVDFNIKRPADLDSALPQIVDTVKQAVADAQAAGQKAQRMKNIGMITLATMYYQSANGNMPPAAIEKDGKRLLSWRVAILPFMKQNILYKKFHLDEPWDSPHNLELVKSIPAEYRLSNTAVDGKTAIMVFTGKDTPFDGSKGILLSQITDGLSNTICCVEAGADKAVIWTKPDDLPFDPVNPLAALGDIPPEGFYATMFDGSVRRLKVDNATLKAMITPAGGEALPGR